MTARLRHIVLVTGDLAGAVARARDGFGLAPGIRDAEAMRAFDLEHEVLVLGSAYLEICQLHPRDFGTLLELDRIVGPGDWHWDEEFPAAARAAERALPTAAVIAVPEPVPMARRWAEVFGGELAGTSVGLRGITVSFADAGDKRPGLLSVDMTVPPDGEAGALEVAGVVFVRSPA